MTTLIENTIKAVSKGSDLAKSAQVAFMGNMENAAKVGGIIEEIAAASDEQAHGIEQVNKAVQESGKGYTAERGKCRGIGISLRRNECPSPANENILA